MTLDVGKMINSFYEMVKDAVMWCINQVIKAFGAIIDFIVDLIPSLSIPSVDLGALIEYQNSIGWIVPWGTLEACIATYVTSTVFYFTYGIILRWAKVI